MIFTRACLIFALLACAGCATHPFEPVHLIPLDDNRAESVYTEARSSVPDRFTVLSSVVFDYRGRSLSVLGYTQVDAVADTFTVVALSPMGMKLFELRGNGIELKAIFMAPQLTKYADPVDAIGADIRKIYLDMLPAQAVLAQRKTHVLVFENKDATGRTEYVVGGSPAVLIEKRRMEAGRSVWRVTYHDYTEYGGKRYPGGIALQHFRYGYRLTIRLKEIIKPAVGPEGEAKDT